jgi:prepilin signal peptidase PulO-like enzyme (type II secretory pathway)
MNRLTKVFIILILCTIYTFLIGWFEINSSVLIAILLLTTFIKGHLIIDYFMGLKNVKGKFRYIPAIWLGSVISLIALGYYI